MTWIRMRRVTAVLVGALALVATACGDDAAGHDEATETGPVKNSVIVKDAWARTSAEMQNAGAVYLTIVGGKQADQLTSASVATTIAAKTELHETAMAGTNHGAGTTMAGSTMAGSSMAGSTMAGVMTMSPVSSIEVPAGKVVKLEPGGYHIMLTDLAKPLTAGQSFIATLTFAGLGTVEVPVVVRAN